MEPTRTHSGLVGARPYGLEERASFHGRDRETESLAEKLRLRPLTVLSACSGTGKSSLIEAGVVPRLLMRRITSVGSRIAAERQQADLPALAPMPFVFRDWGARDCSFSDIVVDSVRRQLGTLPAQLASIASEVPRSGDRDERTIEQALQADTDVLAALSRAVDTSGTSDLGQVLTDVAQALGRVTFMFDQLEEVLRDPRQQADIVARLAELRSRAGRGTNLLLSFRADLPSDAMRALQTRLSIGADEILDLHPLRSSAAQEVFTRQLPNVPTPVVAWLVDLMSEDGLANLPELATACWWADSREGLRALEQMRVEASSSAEADEGAHPARSAVVEASYSAWIDNALSLARPSADPANRWSTTARDSMTQLMPVMLADLADLLVEESDGVAQKASVTRCRIEDAAYRTQLGRRGRGRVRDSAIGSQVDDQLRLEFHSEALGQLLECLRAGNVLKRTGRSDRREGERYELVHDASGPALLRWAESEKAGVSFRVSSSQLGVTWDWARSAEGDPLFTKYLLNAPALGDDRLLTNIAWDSCVIGREDALAPGANDSSRATGSSGRTFIGATGVDCRITDSSFERTIFLNCDFADLRFDGCDFSDTVFIGCTLTNVSFSDSLLAGAEFRSAQAETKEAAARSQLTAVEFRDCAMRGVVLSQCDLAGVSLATVRLPGRSDRRPPIQVGAKLDEVGAFYLIVRDCLLKGFSAGRAAGTPEAATTDAPRLYWAGGALRNCAFSGRTHLRGVDMGAFAIEDPTFLSDADLLFDDCDATAAIFLDERRAADAVRWRMRFESTVLTGSVFLGITLASLWVGRREGADAKRRVPCRGMVLRGRPGEGGSVPLILEQATVSGCDLMGLTVESCLYGDVGFEDCDLDRSGFYDLEGLTEESTWLIERSRMRAWQCSPPELSKRIQRSQELDAEPQRGSFA